MDLKLRKEQVLKWVRTWADKWVLVDHEEPKRTRRRRGDVVGFGRAKKVAAALQVLHPAFTLREIADGVEISGDLVRKWRREPEFEDLAEKYRKDLGKSICHSLEFEQEGVTERPKGEARLQVIEDGREQHAPTWIDFLPFFHTDVAKIVYRFLRRKVGEGKIQYAGCLAQMELEKTGDPKIYRRLHRKFIRNPEWLEAYKGLIKTEIDFLATLAIAAGVDERAKVSTKTVQNFAEDLKTLVFALVNDLAK